MHTRKQLLKLTRMRLIALIIMLQATGAIRFKHLRHRRKGGRKKSHSKAKHRHLRAGIHRVKVGKKMRKVKVLASGKWRFMKG